jgi:hypothetical protein
MPAATSRALAGSVGSLSVALAELEGPFHRPREFNPHDESHRLRENMMRTAFAVASIVAASMASIAGAGQWSVANAAANGSPSPPNPFTVQDVASLALFNGVSNVDLSANAANNVVQDVGLETELLNLNGGAMSATAGNTLISFFGIHNTNDGLDYFGFVIDNQTASGVSFNLSTSFFTTGSNGAISSNTNVLTAFNDPVYGPGHFVDTALGGTTSFSVGAGQADYFMFAGVGQGDVVAMGGGVAPSNSIVSVQWLTAGYAVAYSDTTTGLGGANVELGLVTNVVPVPAPALLAAVGLAGAAVVRRRLAA